MLLQLFYDGYYYYSYFLIIGIVVRSVVIIISLIIPSIPLLLLILVILMIALFFFFTALVFLFFYVPYQCYEASVSDGLVSFMSSYSLIACNYDSSWYYYDASASSFCSNSCMYL